MTPENETNMYEITSYFTIINKKNIIKNIINNYPNILNDFRNRYNNLPDDVKNLCDIAENMQKLNTTLETTILKLKNDFIEVKKTLTECRHELSRAQDRMQPVSESNDNPENICVICMTNPRECAYVNCGHVCACIECCERMDLQCPICRQNGNFIKLIIV